VVFRSLVTAALVALAGSSTAAAQDAKAIASKVLADAIACVNRSDIKCMMATYAADAIDIDVDGTVSHGKAAIEKHTTEAFGGTFKGAKVAGSVSSARMVGADVIVAEGTMSLTAPGKAAIPIMWLMTVRRSQGSWLAEAVMAGVPSK
jgi:uncharacterized protein (TIGR02246 family)